MTEPTGKSVLEQAQETAVSASHLAQNTAGAAWKSVSDTVAGATGAVTNAVGLTGQKVVDTKDAAVVKAGETKAEAGLQEAAGTKLDEAGAKAGEIKQATAVKVEELAKQAQK